MAKNKINSSFLIGLFVLSGSIVIIASIIWLGANEFFKQRNYYVTYFDGSVQGLEQGSPVKYLGVPVGNVNDISISPDNKLVEVKIQIDPKLKVTPDMRIKSEYSGISGGKFLQLFRLNNNEHPPTIKLSFTPEYPVIYSTPSGIDEITDATKEVLNKLMDIQYSEISNQLTDLLTKFNVLMEDKNISLTISNFQMASKNLAVLFRQLDTTNVVQNFIETSYGISNSAEELVQTVKTLKNKIENVQVADFMNKVYNDYDTTMGNLNHFIKNVSVRSDLLIISLNGLIEDLRKSNTQLKNTVQGISDDPSNIFLVRPPEKEK